MKAFIRPISVAAIALGATTLGFGVSAAGATPSNAPSSMQGTFSCDNGATGTFVVNSGNANGAANRTPWNGAHLTFDTGGQGIFHPTAFNLTFFFNGVPGGTNTAQKNNPSNGSTMCNISSVQGPFSLTGSVTGFITTNG